MNLRLLTYTVVSLLTCALVQAELTLGEEIAYESIVKNSRIPASLSLYEGLPHQYHERDVRQHELDTKRVVIIHGESFYEKPITVEEEDIKSLRRLTSIATGFKSTQGIKKCGGFHADYCLVWTSGTSTCYVLVCFGCGEVKFFDEKIELAVDLQQETGNNFGVILRKYRDQRPVRK